VLSDVTLNQSDADRIPEGELQVALSNSVMLVTVVELGVTLTGDNIPDRGYTIQTVVQPIVRNCTTG